MKLQNHTSIPFKQSYAKTFNVKLHNSLPLGLIGNTIALDSEQCMQDFTLYTAEQLKFFLELKKARIQPWFNKECEFEKIYSRMQISDIDKAEGRSLVTLNTKKVDNLFQKDKYFYIRPFADDILSAKFKKYLKTSRNIDAPAIVLDELDGRAVLNFIDGRHRFSVLRDMEMTKMPFSLDEKSKRIAEKYGLIYG